MAAIIDRTGFELDQGAKEWLIEMANGDARQAITMIENTSHLYDEITIETLRKRCSPNSFATTKRARSITTSSVPSSNRCVRASLMRRCIIWHG